MPTPRALEHQYPKTDVSGKEEELGAVRECNVIYIHEFNVMYIYDRFQPSAGRDLVATRRGEVACASLSGGKG